MQPETNKNTLAEALQASGMPSDPVLRARWQAIRAAGGASHVARIFGYKRGEAVRKWYVEGSTTAPTPVQARELVKMAGGIITLEALLPETYGDLTVAELGYQPQ